MGLLRGASGGGEGPQGAESARLESTSGHGPEKRQPLADGAAVRRGGGARTSGSQLSLRGIQAPQYPDAAVSRRRSIRTWLSLNRKRKLKATSILHRLQGLQQLCEAGPARRYGGQAALLQRCQ